MHSCILCSMSQIEHIRKERFKVSQSAFADIAGTSQPTVSRWEAGELEPSRIEMARIRDEAVKRGIEWHDQWFFAVPDADRVAS